MPGMTDLMDYLLALLRDPDAQARFQQDPQASIARAGLREMTGQDVRDVRLLMADRGDVRPSGAPVPPRSDNPVTEIQNTTSSYVAADMAGSETGEREAIDGRDGADPRDDTDRESPSGDSDRDGEPDGRPGNGDEGRGRSGDQDRAGRDDGQQRGDEERSGPWGGGEGGADRPGSWGDGWGGVWGGSSAGTAAFAQNPLTINFVDDRNIFVDDRETTTVDDRDTFVDDRDTTTVDDRDVIDDRDTIVRDSFNSSDDDTQINANRDSFNSDDDTRVTAIRDDDDIQVNNIRDDDTEVTAIRDDDTLIDASDRELPPVPPPDDEPTRAGEATNPDDAPGIESAVEELRDDAPGTERAVEELTDDAPGTEPAVEELTDDGGQGAAADEPDVLEA